MGNILNSLFSERPLPFVFRDPALAAFTNAIWHCSPGAEVIWRLNEAATLAAAPPPKSSAELLGTFCELMERYPTSLLDISCLPASKQKMKTAIKEMWQREPKLRYPLAQMYLYLSHFQDGISDIVLDCKPFSSNVAGLEPLKQEAPETIGRRSDDFQQRLTWEKFFSSEMETLKQEWAKFVFEHGSAVRE